MKILFFIPIPFGVRGTTGTFRLIEELALKYDVCIISPKRPGLEKLVTHHNDTLTKFEIQTTTSKASLYKIKLIFDSFQPDVVYMFNSPFNINFLFTLRHLFPATKWVVDFQTPLLQEGNIRKKIRKKSFFVQLYVDTIFTLSRHSVKTWIPFLIRKTVHVPLGIDKNKFEPKKISAKSVYCRRFVFISSLHRYRKLDFLVENFYLAMQKNPDIQINLDIYGAGPAENELKEMIEKLGVGDRIRFCGLLEQNKLFSLLSEYDAGIAYVPYEKYNKSPSLKSIEYAAAGIHVLASDTVGHKQQMKENGLKFQLFCNEKESFIDAIVNSVISGMESSQLERNLKNVEFCDYQYIVDTFVAPRLQEIVYGK